MLILMLIDDEVLALEITEAAPVPVAREPCTR